MVRPTPMWRTDNLWFETAIVLGIFAAGSILFGRFEEHKPRGRRLLKVAVVLAVTLGLAVTAGRAWALGWLALPLAAAAVIHLWWLPRHGVSGWTGEPRQKYLELLGAGGRAAAKRRAPAAGVRVRAALEGDRDFVLSAARRLASFGPPPWRSAEELVEGESRTLRRFFESPASGSALLVAEAPAEGPLGFAYLETLADYFSGQQHGHIGILAVTEEGEGRGVGGSLLRASEQWARGRGHRKLTLAVFEGNRRARAVYEHRGYAAETLRYVKLLEKP
ncbi:MAG: GNAT family N-acetyltransferase [Thermoanaerobaculia bacterium]